MLTKIGFQFRADKGAVDNMEGIATIGPQPATVGCGLVAGDDAVVNGRHRSIGRPHPTAGGGRVDADHGMCARCVPAPDTRVRVSA